MQEPRTQSAKDTPLVVDLAFGRYIIATVLAVFVGGCAAFFGDEWGVPAAYAMIAGGLIVLLPTWAWMRWKREGRESIDGKANGLPANGRQSFQWLLLISLASLPLAMLGIGLTLEEFPRGSGRIIGALAVLWIALAAWGLVRLTKKAFGG